MAGSKACFSLFFIAEKSFKALDSQKVSLHSGRELDAVNNKEKEKFPQNFYPNVSIN